MRPDRVTLRDVLLLLGIAAVLLADGMFLHSPGGPGVLGVLAVALAVVPLLWRRAAPLAVLPFVVLGIVACLATLKPANTVALPGMVALYSVARYGDRRRSLAVAAVAFPLAVALVLLFSGGISWGDQLRNAAFVLGALAVGDAVRLRCEVAVAEADRRQREERERELEAERRVADERLRIARDVHDVVAHAMVAINVQAGVAGHLLATQPETAAQALAEIRAVSGTALTDLRATLGLLRGDEDAAPLRPAGDLGRLDALASPLRSAGILVDVDLRGDAGLVAPDVGTAAYRIVQEALTNVLRHAGASAATVRVDIDERSVAVAVTDDGAGAPPTGVPAGAGTGVRGMAERAAAVGGSVEVGPAAGGAWQVVASLPTRGAPA